jgi:hypothetical protein
MRSKIDKRRGHEKFNQQRRNKKRKNLNLHVIIYMKEIIG